MKDHNGFKEIIPIIKVIWFGRLPGCSLSLGHGQVEAVAGVVRCRV
jgi:hypothetical protein